jgi:transcription initiation factor IIF auxiliary subunit
MNLQVKCQIVVTDDGKVQYRKPVAGGREHFPISVWIDGSASDLRSIASVEYLLHSTFRRPSRSSENSLNKFLITFWTWGMFNIAVTIHFKDGTTEKIPYYLSYELPPDNGSNYVQVEKPQSETGSTT